jgi:hypothetical protein
MCGYKYISVITNNYKLMRGLRTPFELHGTPVGLTLVDSSGPQWISPSEIHSKTGFHSESSWTGL